MVLNGKLTVLAARQSDRAAFIVFTGGSVARAMVCPLVVFLPGWLLKLPVIAMCVWLAITYLLCLITECIWIVIALKKHVAIHKPRKTAPKVQPNYMDWSI
jgi:fumarate reductase subunit D